MIRQPLLFLAAAASISCVCHGDDKATYDRKVDVVYGRKHGTALTMDVFTPRARTNGAAVIWVVSGGWVSSHEAISPDVIAEFLRRGYTVFAVVHGSQPKFTIPEIVNDIHRAVRFIRYRANDFHIDPERIGIAGASAGGHLSLMQGTTGDTGDKRAKDPVDQTSSRVQAVGCFFPPTDFLNYGKPGENAVGRGILTGFKAAFDFHEWDDAGKVFTPITDEAKIEAIARRISPAYHASTFDPPTLIIHGDADVLVPIQQAELMVDKLKLAGVETKLVVKKGGQHGWPDFLKDVSIVADWFDAHFLTPPKPAADR